MLHFILTSLVRQSSFLLDDSSERTYNQTSMCLVDGLNNWFVELEPNASVNKRAASLTNQLKLMLNNISAEEGRKSPNYGLHKAAY